MISFDDAKKYLPRYCQTYLQQQNVEHTQMRFICPYCNSGANGNNNDAGFRIIKSNRRHYKCDVCNAHGDIFQLIQDTNPTLHEQVPHPTRADAIAYFESLYKPIDKRTFPKSVHEETAHNIVLDYTAPVRDAQAIAIAQTINATWHNDLLEHPEFLTHLHQRGFDLKTINDANIGYDLKNNWYVLPFPNSDYFVKYIPDAGTGTGNRYISMPNRMPELYNVDLLQSNDVVFITESILDALSIQQCGFGAIALCGIGNMETACKQIIESHPQCAFIIMLDNDADANGNAGQKAQQWMYETLRQNKIIAVSCTTPEFLGNEMGMHLKDANDCLKANAKRFAGLLQWNVHFTRNCAHRKKMYLHQFNTIDKYE